MKLINSKSIITNRKFLITLSLFLSLCFSCNTTESPSNKKITLAFEDASCTEAWLNIKLENISLPIEIKLKQNDSTVIEIKINSNDTTLFVESLLPNQTYNFQASSIKNQTSSIKLPITTMDTTSHNFTLDTFTFGDRSSSYFYDVAIINENNIWAVGSIRTEDTDKFDSNGIWVKPYNAVHWDGVKWELLQIQFYTICGQTSKTPYPARSILALGENNILISAGDQIALIEGNFQKSIICIPFSFSINKLWGNSLNSIYAVGSGGNIVHYDGTCWQKIDSGTETNINDIWGIHDADIYRKNINCAVSNKYTSGDHKILSINENKTVSSMNWNTDRRVHSIWFEDNLKMFTCGGGVFMNSGNDVWNEQTELPLISTNRIRGTAKNDIFVGGDFGLLAHFNGVSWYVYKEANVALFYSLDYKNNILTAVGERDRKAVILVMKR